MPGLLSNYVSRGHRLQLDFNVQKGSTLTITERTFVWFDSANNTLKPVGGTASGLVRTWSSEKQARRDAAARFAGVANFTQTVLDPARQVTVDTGCFMRVKVASGTYKVGTLLGFQKDASSNYLYADQLTKVIHPAEAIAVCMTAGSSLTEVEAYVISSREFWNQLINLVKIIPFYVNATNYAANSTKFVTDWSPGFECRLINAKFVADVATTGAGVFTFHNGSNALDDTLTVPTTTGIGVSVEQDIDDAADYNVFLYNDALDITADDGDAVSAGSGMLYLSFMALPTL
ncbi:MAG: hypothetical protein E6Q97_37165 [Desulfurellales bacterium]|nr:MAG: hypothetical protein E6Q97_37165 [Desulfurellales bacterium]